MAHNLNRPTDERRISRTPNYNSSNDDWRSDASHSEIREFAAGSLGTYVRFELGDQDCIFAASVTAAGSKPAALNRNTAGPAKLQYIYWTSQTYKNGPDKGNAGEGGADVSIAGRD